MGAERELCDLGARGWGRLVRAFLGVGIGSWRARGRFGRRIFQCSRWRKMLACSNAFVDNAGQSVDEKGLWSANKFVAADEISGLVANGSQMCLCPWTFRYAGGD